LDVAGPKRSSDGATKVTSLKIVERKGEGGGMTERAIRMKQKASTFSHRRKFPGTRNKGKKKEKGSRRKRGMLYLGEELFVRDWRG